jgi:hypothetical protein
VCDWLFQLSKFSTNLYKSKKNWTILRLGKTNWQRTLQSIALLKKSLSFLASWEILCALQNQHIQYRIHNSLPHVLTLSHKKPIHVLPTRFPFNIIFLPARKCSKWSFLYVAPPIPYILSPTSLLVSFPFKRNTLRKGFKNVVTSKGIQVGIECKEVKQCEV